MLLVYFTGKKTRKRNSLHNLHMMRRKVSKCQSKLLINVDIFLFIILMQFFAVRRKEKKKIQKVYFLYISISRFTDLHGFISKELSGDDNLSLEEKCEKMKCVLGNASGTDIKNIAELTVDQNESDMWHKARSCRITASKCHDVMTRMKTIDKDSSQNTDNLVRRLLYSKNICTSAMEKGRIWEEKAFMKYRKVMEMEKHSKLSVTKSGLIISEDVILGASPDGFVSCECHGKGVLEIKSATKFEDKDPNEKEVIENLPYIKPDGKEMKKSHKYHSQVQFQMGITGRSWCHLVVFTPKCMEANVKPLIVYVKFDKKLFEKLVKASVKFWYQHLLPEIIEKKIFTQMKQESVSTHDKKGSSIKGDHMYALSSDGNNASDSNCPICHTLCKDEEEVTSFSERSIGCDSCNAWFHFVCVQMTAKKLKEIGEGNWYCVLCDKANT